MEYPALVSPSASDSDYIGRKYPKMEGKKVKQPTRILLALVLLAVTVLPSFAQEQGQPPIKTAPLNPGFYVDTQLEGFDNTTCNVPRREFANFKIVQYNSVLSANTNADTGYCGSVFWKPANVQLTWYPQTVRIKPFRHLGKTLGPGTIADQDHLDFGLFKSGDIDDSNTVDIFDFNYVKNAFGVCSGHPNYNPLADLNDDGCVDVTDYNLVRNNFGQSGSPPI